MQSALFALRRAGEPTHLTCVILPRQGPPGEKAMDWKSAMVRTETPHATPEDDAAYAAGWNISGLATLGTIIAVWMFAIRLRPLNCSTMRGDASSASAFAALEALRDRWFE